MIWEWVDSNPTVHNGGGVVTAPTCGGVLLEQQGMELSGKVNNACAMLPLR